MTSKYKSEEALLLFILHCTNGCLETHYVVRLSTNDIDAFCVDFA